MIKKTEAKSRKKLTLNTETVRRLSENLTEQQLREVAGGRAGVSDACTSRTTGG